MADAGVFRPDEIATFLTYIGIDQSHPLHGQRHCGDAVQDLHLLQQLQIHFLSTVPFENLSQHYSVNHNVNIGPRQTYQKIVLDGRGRGGYCMENIILYNHMLRGLGFSVYLTPVRSWRAPVADKPAYYDQCTHVTNLVTLSDGTKYNVDVGFGGEGPTAPVPLVHDQPQVNLGTQYVRLWRDYLPQQSNRSAHSKYWVYQIRNRPEDEWTCVYAFAEYEAFEEDFQTMNWNSRTNPGSRMTYTVFTSKFLRRPVSERSTTGSQHRAGADQEIYGKRVLVDGRVVKENTGGRSVEVEVLNNERERIEALNRWFGLTLTNVERDGISDWCTSLDADKKPGEYEVWHVVRGEKPSYEYKGLETAG